jgi:2-iminoacetate synthase ThiH
MLLPKPASSPVRAILDQALAGKDVTREQGTVLFQARGADLEAIVAVADQLRRQVVGDEVTFAVNRNINFTNICYMGCQFCGFAKRMEEEGAEFLSLETIVARAREAWERGATEVCIQGGLHPKMEGTHYRDILLAIKAELPDMHIHAFSPFEIWYGVKKTGMSIAEFLSDLKACGLGSMPGTAAEILGHRDPQGADPRQADRRGVGGDHFHRASGWDSDHGDDHVRPCRWPEHWSDHLVRIRDIQAISRDKRADSRDKTSLSRDKQGGHSFRGFTEFVPLSFVHEDAPLYRKDPSAVRPGPTREEVVLMHAVSRIMLHGYIDNIQVSWTKLGPEMAQAMLGCGVNDLGRHADE